MIFPSARALAGKYTLNSQSINQIFYILIGTQLLHVRHGNKIKYNFLVLKFYYFVLAIYKIKISHAAFLLYLTVLFY